MVAVKMDGNYIDAEPIKSRSTKDLIKAYQSVLKHWEATGVISPNWHVLDNEAPADYKDAIRKNGSQLNLPLQIYIVEILLSEPSKHERTISFQFLQG